MEKYTVPSCIKMHAILLENVFKNHNCSIMNKAGTKFHRVDGLAIHCLLSGVKFAASHTESSNKSVVTTDLIKSMYYILAT
ncbi:hypothetical protein KI688_000634 [Linnemannia hyalina]|uniref:Uncharacterized protein n=1 Tax=Linnemannia hyalina TaxID=64524 RepID=A0A9P7Y6V4_9FUNG|nr:hypothetical protein KI688_000634 [Linnemannia hyalina]